MNKIIILCLILFFSIQTHGAGKWRERVSRFLPFIAPKARKWENKRKAQLTKMVTSLSDRELVVLDLELKGNTDNIKTIEQMAQLTKAEINRRTYRAEHAAEILRILSTSLTTRLDSILHNPVTTPHFFEVLQDAIRGNPPQVYRGALEKFFFANIKTIMALDPSLEQFKDLSKAIYSTDNPTKILQKALNKGKGADEFFAIFNTIAISSPDDKYLDTLETFFIDNNDAIEKLSFSIEQVERISNYVQRAVTSTVLLKGGLNRAEGDADKFFEVFNAVARPSPDHIYKNCLDVFFTNNANPLATLPFSIEQIKRISRYINRLSTSIMFLKEGLRRARGDGNKFFEVFNAIHGHSTTKPYKAALQNFFTSNADVFENMHFYTGQIKRINSYINTIDMGIIFLKWGLKQAKGDADKFFAIFNVIAAKSPNDKYQEALDTFFTSNAEAIGKLSLSPEQIEHIGRYIDRTPTTVAFLKEGLKRAKGDADRFFAFFHAVATPNPSSAYRDALNKLFADNAETLKEMPFSPEQAKHLAQYINKPSTWTVLLEGGLKQAKGDADQFFAIFDAINWGSPDQGHRDALNKFFIDNAETLKEVPFSPEQVKYITQYINKPATWIILLEGGLKRARENANEFFAIFEATTWGFPNNDDQDALNKFFAHNAEHIRQLPFSAEQAKRIGHYIKRVKTVITLLEGGLMRAERNPDEFFAIFNTVATIPPNSKYRDALNNFFADNAENIGELPFSAEQIERIGRYFHISSPSSPLFDMLEGLKKNQKRKGRKKQDVCAASVAALEI